MLHIMIADQDRQYCEVIQAWLLENYGDLISLELVTDQGYYDGLFQRRHELDLLIVSSALFKNDNRFDYMTKILVLEESEPVAEWDETHADVFHINKYTNVKAVLYMIGNIMDRLKKIDMPENRSTKIIMVTAASGGVGKTTVAVGLCAALHRLGRKVLYIDAEYLQTFSIYMKEKSYIEDDVFYDILDNDDMPVLPVLEKMIRSEEFDYLPPFKKALIAMNQGLELFTEIIKTIQRSNRYDNIVLDTGKEFSLEKAKWMSLSDKVLFVQEVGTRCEYDFDVLKKEISDIEDEKYLVVHNKVDNSAKDQLGKRIDMERNITLLDKIDVMNLEFLGIQEDLVRLCFLI